MAEPPQDPRHSPERTRLDPELAQALGDLADADDAPAMELSARTLPRMRESMEQANPTCAEAIGDRAITSHDRMVPGPEGQPDLAVTILRPRDPRAGAPGLYNIHGGGMVLDNRFSDLPRLIGLVEEFGLVAVSVEYRLAPEHPHPAPVEDCYAGLQWMVANADTLGVDRARVIVCGGSAGGGLSAGVSLLARDRGGPDIAGQMLLCPMIDDRNDSASTLRHANDRVWNRASNDFGWRALLGSNHGADEVSPYAAPARARDLSGLPRTFIEVGSAEIFLCEDVEFGTRLWQADVPTELHVWAGAFHGFDRFAPGSEVTGAALAARSSWIRRTLAVSSHG